MACNAGDQSFSRVMARAQQKSSRKGLERFLLRSAIFRRKLQKISLPGWLKSLATSCHARKICTSPGRPDHLLIYPVLSFTLQSGLWVISARLTSRLSASLAKTLHCLIEKVLSIGY